MQEAQLLKEAKIMKLEHISQNWLEKEIIKVFSKYLNFDKYKIFFFGSRVSGNSNERSDIDVGILGPCRVPSEKWLDIQEEIENIPTLYTIDVVDFQRVSERFKKAVYENIEFISHKA